MVDQIKTQIIAIDARISLLSARSNGMNGNIIKKLKRQKRRLLAKV